MEHSVTIGINTESKQKAIEVATALVEIRNILGDNDTIELAGLLKRNPGIIKTAKKFLR